MTLPLAAKAAVLAGVACITIGCAAPVLNARPGGPQPAPTAPLSELWVEPADLGNRDLSWGPGAEREAPSRNVVYTVVRRDTSGYSRGYDVAAPDGRTWDIKVGKEVQPEIVLSRILWALGYHQPATYYMTDWQLTGSWKDEGQPARFRLKSDHEAEGEWEWRKNPFVGTRALNGLVAVNILLNNWDLKTSNNRVYRLTDARAERPRRYVVQDLGASLGKPRTFFIGTRNDIDGFEEGRLIGSTRGSNVSLDHYRPHREILERVSVADIVWACELMKRLSDRQLDDAFKAAAYEPEVRGRYIRKIRAKIEEGLALRSSPDASLRQVP